jgi:hypothetical protein
MACLRVATGPVGSDGQQWLAAFARSVADVHPCVRVQIVPMADREGHWPIAVRLRCIPVFPLASPFHGARGGSRYSVMAKITYTINTSTPTNHAERPLFVTSAAVMVAMSIITTAPGQKCRLIGVGPST